MRNNTPYTTEEYRGEFNLKLYEKVYIQEALKRTRGNQTKSAALLGISVRKLRDAIRRHELTLDHYLSRRRITPRFQNKFGPTVRKSIQ